ncbi:hypothetical protein LCGC14_1231510 [marine sediment metagenome]|uniref:Radical SAM core domain-containing protein n=1 Tax=marine sediment metagenome TaxID=412755 RepID=A0A0F9L8F5_9ZZZZ
MKEWSEKNKYNSFSSFKGLTYYEHYKKIMAWLDGGKLPAPIECSLDPITVCNHRCYYCNSQRYLKDEPLKGQLSYNDMYNLVDYLAKWGVRGICFGGGGESTLNFETQPIMGVCKQKGMEVALVTNGSMLYNSFLREELMDCRWVGISVDASNKDEHIKIHGVDMFDQVVEGIRELVLLKKQSHGKVDIAIKFLVLPENVNSIYKACLLAKSIGVDDFHVRPVDLQRKDYKMAQRLNLDMEEIREEFAKCHTEETDDFRVYTVVHKYDEAFHVKHDFNKCLASPLVLQVCTDGECYVCVDHRREERFKLGPMDDLSWWGGDKHRELVQSIDPKTECSRCTWGIYNEQITEVVQSDNMCLSFP